MQLHAVVVPPSDVVLAALEAASELACAVPTTPQEKPRGRLLGRLRGRGPVEPAGPAVRFVPAAPEAVFVRLAKFGNVTAEDAADVAAALRAVAGTWTAPVLYVGRITVAEQAPFDVRAQLEGDVDALRDIYRNVNEVARAQRFFLDRRSFRAQLVIGSLEVGDETPSEAVIAEVAHRGRRWSPDCFTLVRPSFAAGLRFVEVAPIALAAVADDLDLGAGA